MPTPSSDRIENPVKPLVLVTHEFYPHHGGIAIYAAEIAKAAHALGHSVEVWAPALPVGTNEPSWPFPVRRLALAGNHSLLSQWRMARHLRRKYTELGSAVLYVPEPGPLLALLLLQYFDAIRPSRLVLTFHGSEIQRLASRRLLRWSTGHLLKKASSVSVVSAYARELFLRHFPGSADKVVLTPGALRTDLAPIVPSTPRANKSRIVILTVARINPRKGQLQVINALKALPPAQRKQIEYWLVGCHSKENYDTALSNATSDADFHVKFLGDISDEKLGHIYQKADIFAMTSMPHKHSIEGFGLVYLEAGAHGLPVVAHNIGGVPEAVVHDETGLLVAPGDGAGLTAAFARLISDPTLRHRLGAAGRKRALKNSWRDSALALFGQSGGPTTT